MTLPIVFVPGHLCGRWLYDPQISALADRDTIVADTFNDDSCGAMAKRLLAAVPDRFVLAGLSMGGMVAMEVMARAPGRIAGAILMGTDPTAAREKEIIWRNGLLDQGMDRYVGAFVDRFYLHSAATADRLGPATRTQMAATPEPVARAQARALDNRRMMVSLIEGYGGPVTVIVGADDKVCPPVVHEGLRGALPQARMVEIPGCGHIATLERPEAVNAELSALIEAAERHRH